MTWFSASVRSGLLYFRQLVSSASGTLEKRCGAGVAGNFFLFGVPADLPAGEVRDVCQVAADSCLVALTEADRRLAAVLEAVEKGPLPRPVDFVARLAVAVVPRVLNLLGRSAAILFVPDFVANCGGILSSAMRGENFDLEDVRYLVETTFSDLVYALLQASDLRGESFRDFVRLVTWQNHLKLSDPNKKIPGMRERIPQLLIDKDWPGIKSRIGYRIPQRNPASNGVFHQSALERYA